VPKVRISTKALVAVALGVGTFPATDLAHQPVAASEDLFRLVAAPVLGGTPPPILGRKPAIIPKDSGAMASIASSQVPVLQRAFGERFAGAWDVPIAHGVVLPTVALVGANPDDAQRVSALLATSDVQVVSAHRSLRDLEGLRDRVLAELGRSGISEYAVGINVPANVVTIAVDLNASIPAWLSKWLIDLDSFPGLSVETTRIESVDDPNPHVEPA
jgi:hypothetical protein